MTADSSSKKLNYAAAGVDIKAGNEAVSRIKKLARETFTDGVLSQIGSFGGFFKPDFSNLKAPVFISSADGVGTKLKLAFMTGRHTTVGEDLVNHCLNDILVHGARGLFFLDYIATGKLSPDVIADLVEGLARGCRNNGMALLGGETAEMPDFYQAGEYDLAGFIVGMVDQEKVINGSTIQEGDIVLGLPSNGLHTNGYTLARKVAFEIAGCEVGRQIPELGCAIDEALMKVHRCYAPLIHPLLEQCDVHGMAHITGGGLPGNLNRVLPEKLDAEITKGSWPVPEIFPWLERAGDLDPDDMYSAFNMGIGYVLVLSPDQATKAEQFFSQQNEKTYRIGRIISGTGTVRLV